MAKKLLSPEEIAILQNNPFVASASAKAVTFTPEFKRITYARLTSRVTIRKFLEELGIDPDILGDYRLYNFTFRLRTEGGRDNGFADRRGGNSRKEAKKSGERTLTQRVEELEHELAYAQQEVEFLKKIHTADLEARKQWEYKQRRK